MRRILTFLVLLLMQFLLNDYVNVGQYVVLCMVPLMVLSLPQKWSTPAVMAVAFACGLIVDLLSDGVLGLNAAAATLAGTARNFFFDMTVGKENYEREAPATPQAVGVGKYTLYLLLTLALYLVVYVFLDGFAVRPIGFYCLRTMASVAANLCLSLFVSYTLVNEK